MAISTYTELQAAIRQYTRRTTTSDTGFEANIPNFVALAESWINRKLRVKYMETLATLTVTQDVANVALPTGYRQFKRLYLNGDLKRPLSYIAPEQFYTEYADGRSGVPIHYTIEGARLILAPTPAESGTINAIYWKALTALATTPTNDVLTYYPDIYLMPCLAEAFGYLKDFDMKAKYYAQAAAIADEMMREDLMDRHSGSVMQIRSRTGVR